MEARKESAHLFWIGVTFATLAGAGLRYVNIWENEFWTDELLAIRSSHTMETIGDHCFSRFTSPPLRYLLTWFFLNYPHEDCLVRLPSLLTGILSIVVAALLARKWFGGMAGFWSAWAMALNPWMVAYSQDGRMHIVAMFFYLASIWLIFPLPTERKRTLLIFAGTSLAISSAVTYAAVIVCFGGILVAMLECYRSSKRECLGDMLALCAPWGLWMFSWLALLWVVTSTSWEQVPSSAEVTVITAPPTVASESESTPLSSKPSGVPLLDPSFYQESLANTWEDRPLKVLVVLGAFFFFLWKGESGCPKKTSRILFFAIPLGVILFLQPDQFYRRYLLSLLPFPLIGVGILGAFLSRKVWGAIPFAAVLIALSLQPTLWVLERPPQAWRSASEYLEEHLQPGDQLLMGTHQCELAASYYMVGKIPTWEIVYNGMFLNRFKEYPSRRGTCWFVQWFGMPTRLEQQFEEFYDKVRIFPGRFGNIMIFQEKASKENSPSAAP